MEQRRPVLSNGSLESTRERSASRSLPLSQRRQQVLVLYLRGLQRKQIAYRLGLSPHTVRNHIRFVYERFGFSNRIEALRWALEQPTLVRQILSASCDGNHGAGVGQHPIAGLTSVDSELSEAIQWFRRESTERSLETT